MNGDDESPESAYQTRRATLEDLPQLRALWQGAHLDPVELEKRFTEFQIALNGEGEVAGAIGLQMNKLHGLVHSEAFANPGEAAEIRPLLWPRILTVAKNNGLQRIWALPTTSFYREQGMTDIDDALRAKLPEGFGSPMADWVTLKLKEESPGAGSIEKEFEVFAMAQRAESEKVMDQAKAFKLIAYGLLILVLGALGILAFIVGKLKRNR
jgi:N-acetylglutamate synthase-like GNAT family acetyltransferase